MRGISEPENSDAELLEWRDPRLDEYAAYLEWLDTQIGALAKRSEPQYVWARTTLEAEYERVDTAYRNASPIPEALREELAAASEFAIEAHNASIAATTVADQIEADARVKLAAKRLGPARAAFQAAGVSVSLPPVNNPFSTALLFRVKEETAELVRVIERAKAAQGQRKSSLAFSRNPAEYAVDQGRDIDCRDEWPRAVARVLSELGHSDPELVYMFAVRWFFSHGRLGAPAVPRVKDRYRLDEHGQYYFEAAE